MTGNEVPEKWSFDKCRLEHILQVYERMTVRQVLEIQGELQKGHYPLGLHLQTLCIDCFQIQHNFHVARKESKNIGGDYIQIDFVNLVAIYNRMEDIYDEAYKAYKFSMFMPDDFKKMDKKMIEIKRRIKVVQELITNLIGGRK